MKNNIWRLWCYALGAKSGKNNKEANIVAIIRSFMFLSYLLTNLFIIAGVVRHWSDKQTIEIFIENSHEVPGDLHQKEKEINIQTGGNLL
jgi:hypothetical protein